MERTLKPSDPETQQNNKHQRSERAGRRVASVCACLSALPYLHYLCAGLSDEVLLVGIYDSHLDQSIGLPVSSGGHQIITGFRQ